MTAAAPSAARICVAAVAGAKGARGAVRLKTFTETPDAVARFRALEDESGRPVRLALVERRERIVIVRIEGVETRAAAEELRGTRLYAPRAELPPPGPEEFYHADLIGLRAALADGRAVGAVVAVHDFGAGDIIEIAGANGPVLLPFTRESAPEICIAEGRMTIAPPPRLPGLEEAAEPEP